MISNFGESHVTKIPCGSLFGAPRVTLKSPIARRFEVGGEGRAFYRSCLKESIGVAELDDREPNKI